ncbi:MAG: hypothetical protein H6702_19485 [Myxococcales bacterium]|nr:hypothetical protein [Myxococcales bacterium]
MATPDHRNARPPWPVVAWVALSLGMPLWAPECLPWTDAALFTDAQVRFARYRVTDAATGAPWAGGQARLSPRYSGLRGDSARFPGPAPGALQREAAGDLWGVVLEADGMQAALAPAWARGGPAEAAVERRIYGRLPTGAVGLLETRQFHVRRP